MKTIEKRIAANLFAEFNHRHGRLVPARVQDRGHYAENIIAYGELCVQAGQAMELDALVEYMMTKERHEVAEEAVHAVQDEVGIANHLASPQSQP